MTVRVWQTKLFQFESVENRPNGSLETEITILPFNIFLFEVLFFVTVDVSLLV